MEDKIFSFVRNFKEYGYYKRNITAVAKLLKKKFPSLSEDECLAILNHYCALYEKVGNLVHSDKESVLLYYHDHKIKDWLLEKKILPDKKFEEKLNGEKLILTISYFIVHWAWIR